MEVKQHRLSDTGRMCLTSPSEEAIQVLVVPVAAVAKTAVGNHSDLDFQADAALEEVKRL